MDDEARPHAPLERVVLVTGKGGVGKTTVAAGLAEAAVRTLGQAVLVEFSDGASGKRVLGKGSRVEHVVVKPGQAIEDMAADLFGSAILAKVVTGNFAMRSLLRAAPALRELGQLEAVRRIAAERPRARVVVDMPATGHGIAWLRVPAQMRDLLGGGPLQELSARLARELVAPGRSSVVIVTLPEKLVLEETLELAEAMRHEVGLSPSRIFVNRVPEAIPPHALKEATRVARSGGDLAHAAGALVEVLAAREQARAEALAALGEATRGLAVAPVLVPQTATDPGAALVADWLTAEAAA